MPTIQIQDRAPLTRVRKLADGRLCATARFARSGVYQYSGSELGRPDLGTVNVYRPEAEVFDEAAMASFAHKAITLNHPSQHVDAANWRESARGYTEGKVARDGDHVEIPLMLADAEAVSAYETGRATELSAGYVCDLSWETGTAPDGTAYQAVQRRIRGNHIALVPQGRAGSSCRIGDSAMSDLSQLNDEQRAQVALAVARAKRTHDVKHAWMGDRAPAFTDAQRQWWEQTTIAGFGGQHVRDVARGGPIDEAAARATYDAAHAELSRQRQNAWRTPVNQEQMRDMARAAQFNRGGR